MYDKKRMVWYSGMFVIGIALILLAFGGLLESFWSGFGVGFCGVGGIRLIQGIRYRKNEEYAKKIDLMYSDERNIFLSNKAKCWTFYLTILGLALGGIVLFALGYEIYAEIVWLLVCTMLLIYWVTYMIISRKY